MSVIVGKIISIFLITAVGFGANRKGILPDRSTRYLVDLLMLITTPCMIISSITSTELTDDTAAVTLQMLLASAVWFAAVFILSWLVCVKILRIRPEEDAGIYMGSMSTINNGFMGFPITLALFGNDILFLMVMFQSMLMIYLYSACILQVNYGLGGTSGTSLRRTLKALKNPSTISSVISILMLLAGIRLPEVLFNTVDTIGSATVPISMIVVGIQLGSSNLKEVLGNWNLVSSSVIKMLCWPILTFLAVNWLPLSAGIKTALIFGAAFPTAVAVVPVSSMENRNSVLAAEIVAFTTLLSVITLPVTAILLMSYYGFM